MTSVTLKPVPTKGCRAFKTSITPIHVHATMFIKDELYYISPSIHSEFATVRGLFRNSLGGTEYRTQSILRTACEKHLIY